jgi:hypothetical protein
LIKPNFMIGEEISLLHPGAASSSAEPSAGNTKRSSVISAGGGSISKEGANTSWTYLRPEDEIGDNDQLPPTTDQLGLKSANGFIARRRAVSFVVNLPDHGSIENPSSTDDRRAPPVRRTQSLCDDPPELSVIFRNGPTQQSSLPRQDPLFHS